jgi:hypothetical protein
MVLGGLEDGFRLLVGILTPGLLRRPTHGESQCSSAVFSLFSFHQIRALPLRRVDVLLASDWQIPNPMENQPSACVDTSVLSRGVGVFPFLSAQANSQQVVEEVGAMPQQAWTAKRERQYQHIKGGLKARGDSDSEAEEIAARTVNKERARNGESKTKSRSSTNDISSGRRGGLRSHRGAGGRTRDQLYAEAKRKGIAGRSRMDKAQLERAVDR